MFKAVRFEIPRREEIFKSIIDIQQEIYDKKTFSKTEFLDFFGLQPHHLPANAELQL